MPFFSIIIPTYNSAATLQSGLDSILLQEFVDYEILIIDGGSGDNTIGIVKSLHETCPMLRYISEPDAGIYDAMNKGIDIASGDWLYFMGSDDQFYCKTVLDKITVAAETAQHHVLYGDVLINGDTSWAKDGDRYDGSFDIKKLFRKNICHQSIFYRRDFVKGEIGYFNLDYKLCADWDFNLRCASKTELVYLNQIIARFNGGGESTQNYMDENFSRDFLKNVMAYFHVDAFDPMINDPQFPYYHEVLALQKDRNYLRYFTGKLKKKIIG